MADYPGAHSLLVGGRGYGKRAAQERELNAYLAAVTAEHPSIPSAEVIGNLDAAECYACKNNWAHRIAPVHIVVPEPTAEDRKLVEVIHDRKAKGAR